MGLISFSDVLSAALDAGTSISTILIYFWYVSKNACLDLVHPYDNSLQYPLNGRIGLHTIQAWWGNTVFQNTADWKGTPLKVLRPSDPPFGYVVFALVLHVVCADNFVVQHRGKLLSVSLAVYCYRRCYVSFWGLEFSVSIKGCFMEMFYY